MGKDDNSLSGWADIIREQGDRDRERRRRFPETAKLSLVSGRWQESLQLIEWLSEHGYMEPNIPADKTQELAARYLGLNIVKLRAETVQQAQEQGDQSDE